MSADASSHVFMSTAQNDTPCPSVRCLLPHLERLTTLATIDPAVLRVLDCHFLQITPTTSIVGRGPWRHPDRKRLKASNRSGKIWRLYSDMPRGRLCSAAWCTDNLNAVNMSTIQIDLRVELLPRTQILLRPASGLALSHWMSATSEGCLMKAIPAAIARCLPPILLLIHSRQFRKD